MKNDKFLRLDVSVIQSKIRGRKVTLRWKNKELEEFLFFIGGIKTDLYVTRDSKRVDNKTSFFDEILRGKSDEYVLIISEELKWNKTEAERYAAMGYIEGEDIFWCSQRPKLIQFRGDKKDSIYKDSHGNYISCKSKVCIELHGVNNHIEIGKNIDFLSGTIKVHSGVKLIYKDNAKNYWSTLELKDDASLIVYE